MKKKFVKGITIVFLMFSGFFTAFAQESIAVHPMNFNANQQMARVFLDELVRAIPIVPGYRGDYTPVLLDLVNNRPADVPPGGFPPYICPPPSLTGSAPYCITGEIGEDADYPGEYWVRLYLWKLDGSQLLASDMISAGDREAAAENYPYVLEFLYSKIDEFLQLTQPAPRPMEFQASTDDLGRHIAYGESWLYLGVSLGGGTATWKEEQVQNFDGVRDYLDINFAFHIIGNLYYPFALQTEANLHAHFYEYQGEQYPIVWSLNVPLFIRINVLNGPISASVYFGPSLFFAMPLFQLWYDEKKLYFESWPKWNSSMGVSYGLTVGWRVGHYGSLFLDGRFNHLIDFGKDREIYPYYGATLCFGYQIGIIDKKKL